MPGEITRGTVPGLPLIGHNLGGITSQSPLVTGTPRGASASVTSAGLGTQLGSRNLPKAWRDANIFSRNSQREVSFAQQLDPSHPKKFHYEGVVFKEQGWLVPKSRSKAGGDLLEAFAVPSDARLDEERAFALLMDPRFGTRLVLSKSYDDLTFLASYLVVRLMKTAERPFSFGLATGGTTEALRKALGLQKLMVQVHGESAHDYLQKVVDALMETLDDYYQPWPDTGDWQQSYEYDQFASSYRSEQRKMLTDNWDYPPHRFISPRFGARSPRIAGEQFRQDLRVFLDPRYRLGFRMHGIGATGHDAFVESMLRVLTHGLGVPLNNLRDALGEAIPANLKQFQQPNRLLRPDGAERLWPLTELFNFSHFGEREMHPFFARFMADKRAGEFVTLLHRLDRYPAEQLINFYPEAKFSFRSWDHFRDELGHALNRYWRTPPIGITQGTGDGAMRANNPDTRRVHLASGPVKAEPLRTAVVDDPSPDATACYSRCVAHSLWAVELQAASKLPRGFIEERCFYFEPTNPNRALMTEKKINEAWKKTRPGKAVTDHLAGQRPAEPNVTFPPPREIPSPKTYSFPNGAKAADGRAK